MERYIDIFLKEFPQGKEESQEHYMNRFFSWMVTNQGAYWPGVEADALKTIQRRIFEEHERLMRDSRNQIAHQMSDDFLLVELTKAALNGIVASDNFAALTDDNLAKKAVSLAKVALEALKNERIR